MPPGKAEADLLALGWGAGGKARTYFLSWVAAGEPSPRPVVGRISLGTLRQPEAARVWGRPGCRQFSAQPGEGLALPTPLLECRAAPGS